jgi:hypothetical protein
MSRKRLDDLTVVIRLSQADRATFGDDLETFRQAVEQRMTDTVIILVDEEDTPLAPLIDPNDIPADALWLPVPGNLLAST